ncbi:MAG: transcriptional regulator [Clostridiales bacterium]|nr:transcriptional regulator [Clostridiales bacterium]
MMEKVDYKKREKTLYFPRQTPMLIEVPRMRMLMTDGVGEPGGGSYQAAIQALYALTFTIKMSKMGEKPLNGYFEYVVPPLEGLWDCGWPERPRTEWKWTSLIRQPEFVDEAAFAWALEQCRRKKPEVDASSVRLEEFDEGLCVQVMHIGAYDDEARSFAKMDAFMAEHGLVRREGIPWHHEIYLSDPRRTAPERLKTVLRIPVRRE